MKKLKIIVFYLIVFFVGSAGIVIYVFYRLTASSAGAGLGSVIVMPAVVLVYVVVFGILCIISLTISLIVSYFRNRVR